MKKIIITTVALAALTFVACKKDNLQPTIDSTTNIEQLNSETTDEDDKAVDVRNYFVGNYKKTVPHYIDESGIYHPNSTYKIKVTKYGTKHLKVTGTYKNNINNVTGDLGTWLLSRIAGKLDYKSITTTSLGNCITVDQFRIYKASKTAKLNLHEINTLCSGSEELKLIGMTKF